MAPATTSLVVYYQVELSMPPKWKRAHPRRANICAAIYGWAKQVWLDEYVKKDNKLVGRLSFDVAVNV
jgi:hypothetical protein